MTFKIFILLLTGLLLTGCGKDNTDSSQQSTNIVENTTTESTSETVPEEPYIVAFEAPDLDGETITSDTFADSKLTMLNVWATYCNPCLSEMPDLGAIAAAYDPSEFQMMGIVSDVSVYDDEDAVSEVKTIVEETGATTYPHLLLSQSLYENLVGAVDSVPTTFFVNQNGELLGYLTGAQSKENWEMIINDLLSKME